MKLLVICEPKFDVLSRKTVNLAMNEILKQYQTFFEEVHCLCPGDRNQKEIIGENGIIFHTVDYYTGSRLNKLAAILKGDKQFLKDIVESSNIDIVQYRIPSFFSLGFYYCYKSINITKTTYIAGDMYENLVNNFHKIPFIKKIANYAETLQKGLIRDTIVVSTGNVLANKYRHLNPNIHAYYSTTHNDILSNFNQELGDTLNIVFLGRVDEAKRLADLVYATKLLHDDGVSFLVNIIGDGPSLLSIKALVDSYNLNDNFKFFGYIADRNKIDSILRKSHVIVLPSVTEGTAKVLPEAMSRGVIPIAVRDVGSNNYIITEGENGFLFKKFDTEDLRDVLMKLIKSKTDYLRVRGNCYSYADERTAIKEIKKMWEFIFRKMK